MANRSFQSFGKDNVGEFTIGNISYFSESGIWLGKILMNDVNFPKFPLPKFCAIIMVCCDIASCIGDLLHIATLQPLLNPLWHAQVKNTCTHVSSPVLV